MNSVFVFNFLTGLFLCNCVPHLVCGLIGEPCPTPFANPPGQGLSSPLVNFLWGMANLAVGLGLLVQAPVRLGLNTGSVAMLAGALVLGCYLALHFGRVREQLRSSSHSTGASSR